ncbi:MAG: acyl carrier protein [Chloroflexi bacterium]|nr:acyl carrier protein [Chloroflexota bacterium]
MDRHEAMREFIQNRLVFGMNKAIGYDDDLLLSGLLDSLNVIRLLAFIQERFGVDVPPEDVVFENFSTINAIVHYLESQ